MVAQKGKKAGQLQGRESVGPQAYGRKGKKYNTSKGRTKGEHLNSQKTGGKGQSAKTSRRYGGVLAPDKSGTTAKRTHRKKQRMH